MSRRADRGVHARRCERGRETSIRATRACAYGQRSTAVCSIPGQLEVGGVDRLAARTLEAVDSRRRPADDLARSRGPLLERILLDDEPDLLEAAFDFLLGADQSRHVRIASSIFGYAPQRQRFPAIAWRISSVDGSAFVSTSATAHTIWPGVQKPHCSASARTNDVHHRMVAQPLDRRHLRAVDARARA